MSRFEAFRADAAVLGRLVRGMPRGASHADSLAAFYGPQAGHYDRFREKLLQGRAELIERLPIPDRAHVVELGGGTGRNAEFFGEKLARIAKLEIVDVCAPLLAEARGRARRIPALRVVEADATRYRPSSPVDAVYFSYALTMIPGWRAAIANAVAMLRPGGVLGVVDFYVSQARPAIGCARHDAITRTFWPRWFAHDGVMLDDAHLPTLRASVAQETLIEARAKVPFLP